MQSKNVVEESASLLQRVESSLPRREPIRIRSEADFYGLSHLIAEKIGLRTPPRSRAAWQHGWVIDPVTDIRQVIGNHPHDQTILVANEVIAYYLNGHGINAIPVGLPLIYSDPEITAKIPGSLLVMPAHVTKHSEHSVNEADYVDFVTQQAKHFDHVLICVSQQCADRGFWVKSFASRGFETIVGAGVDDRNALTRMRRLLSQFEVMTSNAPGSHFLYAGFCGCRLSLSGPEHLAKRSDLAGEPFYQQHPDLVDMAIERYRQRSLLEHYPQLDHTPQNAQPCQDWANEVIGLACKRDPRDLANLLVWGRWDRFRARSVEVIRKNLPRRAA
ncbi:hypothetical protein Pla22_13590 [Rubripirellula amarantea]|uniref:Uncharacterized protein n=1 Tax=Rubripirellula amarantea TaxID=2527999 RepID=A0A5C5WSW4_9BACT|nr:hypothetical protein [Rubripirellula amarantea]TWT53727.1 hypothetical protein Pla22_13590 [Rubripirellula amarantea]